MSPMPPPLDDPAAPREAARLGALAGYHVLDTRPEAAFTRLAALTAQVFQVAITAVSFVDRNREWIKAACGLPTRELGLEASLGLVAVRTGQTQVVPDTLDAGAWRGHPLVTGTPHLRFCASTPLLTPEGHAIGALCIADPRPRPVLGPEEQGRLEDLAALVMDALDRRRLALAQADLTTAHRAALALSETLGAVTALAGSGLGPQELALRITGLTAARLDVDWAGLLAVQDDRALAFGAGHRMVAAGFAQVVQGGSEHGGGGGLWQTVALDDVTFEADYARSATAHSPSVALGVREVATAPLGSVDGVRYVMAFVRLHSAVGWTKDDQNLIRAVVQVASGTLQHMAAQVALATLHDRLRLTVESGPLILWATDMAGRFTLSEGQGLRDLGSAPGLAVGHAAVDIYAGNPAIVRNISRALAGESFTTEVEARHRIFEAHYSPLHGAAGEQSGTVGVAYDITDRVTAERAARRAQAQAEALVALSHVLDATAPFAEVAQQALNILHPTLGSGGVVLREQRGDVFVPIAMAGGVPALLGMQEGGVPAPHLWELGVTQGRAAFLEGATLPPWARQAGIHAVALLPVRLDGSGPALVLGAWATTDSADLHQPDIQALLSAAARLLAAGAQQRQRVQALEGAALTDPLTGLGNRRAFEADYAARVQAARLHHLCVDVISIDVDGLKATNDREGHVRGDVLLQTFAASLRASIRTDDRAYRLGGDEFIVLLTDVQPLGVAGILSRMRDVVARVRVADFPAMDVSVGVAMFPADGDDPAQLLALSDQRMYGAKAGKRRDGP